MLDSPISNPPTPTEGTWEEEQDGLRVLSRSPHPYHHDVDHDVHDVHRELLEPPDLAPVKGVPDQLTVLFGRESTTPISDSGTEADDEHFLKRLPAPRTTLHKGLRGKNESLSGYSTPALTPTSLGDEGHPELGHAQLEHHRVPRRGAAETERRQKEVIRRSTEVLLLLLQGGLIWSNPHARPFLLRYRRGEQGSTSSQKGPSSQNIDGLVRVLRLGRTRGRSPDLASTQTGVLGLSTCTAIESDSHLGPRRL